MAPHTLDWAVALMVFEIALSVRQMIEMPLEDRQDAKPQLQRGLH